MTGNVAGEPVTLVYCRAAGNLARHCGNICIGEVAVSGDGVRRENDEYGVPYQRPCGRTGGRGGIVVRGAGSVAVDGCRRFGTKLSTSPEALGRTE